MTLFDTIIQGIIQGLTEFLPVSSSGHLSLYQHFSGQSGETGALVTIFLHLGTLLAVLVAFWPTIWKLIVEVFRMIGDLARGRFSLKKASPIRRMVLLLILSLAPLCIFVFFKDFFSGISSDNDIVIEGICFLVTAALLFLADRHRDGTKTAKTMTFGDALAIGIVQGVAMMPGISRSGSTTATGMICGLKKSYAMQFSFIMAVPTILAAGLLEIGDAAEVMAAGGVEWGTLLIGMLVAAVVGLVAIFLMKWLLKTDRFVIFAYYTLAIGILSIVAGLLG